MAKGKGYIHKSKFNPAVLSKRIDKQDKIIEQMKLTNDLKYNSLQNFITLLTAFASHDIKNAVHNMDGIMSFLAIDNITQDDINMLKDCLERIRLSLDDFAALGSQKNTENIEGFEISRLMSSLDVLHRHSMRSNSISYSVEYGVDKHLMVHQNFHWLIQLFNNMLINATQALVNVDNRAIKISIEQDEGNLKMTISDTGIGVKPENRERIFDPYFTTTGGSGVGLAHVVYVLREINGSIKLVQEPDFSTSFEVVFPIQ